MYLSPVYMFCFPNKIADFLSTFFPHTNWQRARNLLRLQLTLSNIYQFLLWLFCLEFHVFPPLSGVILSGLLFTSLPKDQGHLVRIVLFKKVRISSQHIQRKSYNTLRCLSLLSLEIFQYHYTYKTALWFLLFQVIKCVLCAKSFKIESLMQRTIFSSYYVNIRKMFSCFPLNNQVTINLS